MIVGAGAGAFHAAYVTMTPGVALPEGERTPEGVAAAWEKIIDRNSETVTKSGSATSMAVMKAVMAPGCATFPHPGQRGDVAVAFARWAAVTPIAGMTWT